MLCARLLMGLGVPFLCASPVWAQTTPHLHGELPPVTVSTPSGPRALFDVAGSIDRVEGAALRAHRLQGQLSEGLVGVPGLQLQDRRNHAQDLQLTVRGFGARSTFGVRGVRIYVDGIPATMPDGQGQTSNIDIGSLDRVELLRGPFSALYGNSSGGVLQAFTAPGEGRSQLRVSTGRGHAGTQRHAMELSGAQALGDAQQALIDYRISTSRFESDGWRAHSAAHRNLTNARLGLLLDNDAQVTLTFNDVRISAQDPLGLTESQWRREPRQSALAQQYNSRKTVQQRQAGLLLEQRVQRDHALRLMLYAGERETQQFQSIPASAQQNAKHAGGVIGLQRRYSGADLRWNTEQLLMGRALTLAAGLSWDGMRETRTGHLNYVGAVTQPVLGVLGTLRRDERNQVTNLDPYAQLSWAFAPTWSLEAGVRRSRVNFDSRDHYLSNGDDSGRARYAQWLPSASVRWQPHKDWTYYASVGRGFETPTLNEISYRPDSRGGLNLELQPALSQNLEIGAKTRYAGGILSGALFRTHTRDEIVTHSSAGGRSSFQNAGRTRRQGAELAWTHQSETHWRTQLAYTWLDARYSDSFCTPTPCAAANQVLAGARLPGVARQAFYGAVAWEPPQGFRAGLDLRAQSRVMANDRNSASAPGYALLGAWVGWAYAQGPWSLEAFARLNNLADRRYAASVIVNESNGRYFEPAPGREWSAGLSVAYRF